jgi:lipopolysaccharide biosynthesis glycosyltransferase
LADLPDAGRFTHISSECYGRLYAPDVLPPHCERVVYLDCDVVVLGDIAVLNDSADSERTISVVPTVRFPYVSSLYEPSRAVVFNYAELGIPASNRYFQSGVMVINLKLWREQNVTSRVIEYAKTCKEKLVAVDQGALNAILYNQWFRLDQRWNQTCTVLTPECWTPPAYSRTDWLKTKNDPFIVHYDSGDKPWNPGFKRPRSSFFYKYLNKTLFKQDCKMSRIALLERIIGYRNYFFLWRMRSIIVSGLSKKVRWLRR